MKMAISMGMSHLCAIIVLNVLIGVILSHPLCDTMDGAESGTSNGAQKDRIYFENSMGVRTIVVNGKRVTCLSETSDTNSSNRSFSENIEETFGTQHNSGTRRNHSANRYPIPTRFQSNNNNQQFYPNPTFVPNDRNCLTKNQPYCLNTTNYPENLIDELIRKSSHKFENVFGSDMIGPIDIGTRNNGNDEDELCDSREEVIYPTSGESQDTTHRLIVNTQLYRQGVRIGRCLNPTKPCLMLVNAALPDNYQSECKQNFVYRQLIAVTPDGNTIKENFKFPACCTCVLKRVQN